MSGQISKILKKNLGIKVQPSQQMKKAAEKSAKYFSKINNPPEPEKKEPLTLDQLKEKFEIVANEITGGFDITEENKPVINTLFYYFTKHPNFYKTKIVKNEPSLDKGILLIGNTGSGKTTILDIFKALKWQGFRKFSTYDIVEDFEKEGEKGITTYFKGNIFFDDLGAEELAHFYGKRENVGTRLLEKRYNSYIREGLKTHVTTNCTLPKLVEKYGFRVEGRIYEMFNIIYLGNKANSIDYRIKNHKK
jgi:hypothetical protein